MYVYLNFLLIFFVVPVIILGFLLRNEIRKYSKTILWCLFFVYTLGLLWDWLSVRTGIWRYDSAPSLGLWIDGLPVEEYIGFYVFGTLFICGTVLNLRKKSTNV
ncbi:lycopene cyclase domain-containing protein [candidate division KSB1 bacterium]